MATLQFLGATGTVTGSKYLLEHRGFRLMIDCGLFQGLKDLRLRNWSPPPVECRTVGLVALTHAHLDHTGYLPVLFRRGYSGRVLTTSTTRDLCGIVLPDSGHLQEEDARFANRRGYSKHAPALPLYTEDEARACLGSFDTLRMGEPRQVHDDVTLTYRAAGHIPGAAFIEVRIHGNGNPGGDRTIVFSGDLGRPDQPILPDPAPLPPCDHLVMESTYGNRDHPKEDPKERLLSIVLDTVHRGGTVLIPTFAIGRAQHLLFLLRELRQENRLPADIPVYLDSPMAIEATRIVVDHPESQDREMRDLESRGADPLGLDTLRVAAKVEDSKALNDIRYPAIILSASGMAEGGRIVHHLAYKLPDHRTTVLFVGYQATGTRGRALQDGARVLRMFGQEVAVRASIETLDGLSAHADRGEILRWLASSPRPPKKVHLIHGEDDARDALAARLREERGLDVSCPDYLDRVEV